MNIKKPQPIRMCISCRGRQLQSQLIRIKQDGNRLTRHDGVGRSLYLCHECIANEKKLRGLSKRLKQNQETLLQLLEELSKNG